MCGEITGRIWEWFCVRRYDSVFARKFLAMKSGSKIIDYFSSGANLPEDRSVSLQ